MSISPERAEVLEDMLSSDAWILFESEVMRRVENKKNKLLAGRTENYEQYKAECASVHELEYILGIPLQLITEARTGDVNVHS